MSQKDGTRIINEDENLILKHVEQGKGDLDKIVKEIKKVGKFTDYISLLKLTYK